MIVIRLVSDRSFKQRNDCLLTMDSTTLVVAHVGKLPSAWRIHIACGKLIERCVAVKGELEKRFPELHV